jgi:hypothetical protein
MISGSGFLKGEAGYTPFPAKILPSCVKRFCCLDSMIRLEARELHQIAEDIDECALKAFFVSSLDTPSESVIVIYIQ